MSPYQCIEAAIGTMFILGALAFLGYKILKLKPVLPVIDTPKDDYVLAEYAIELSTPDKGFNSQTKTLLLWKKRSSLPDDVPMKEFGTKKLNNYSFKETQEAVIVDGRQAHMFTKRVGKNLITLGYVFIDEDNKYTIGASAKPQYMSTLEALATHLTNPYLQEVGLVNAYQSWEQSYSE